MSRSGRCSHWCRLYWAVQLLSSLVPANIMAGMPFLRDLGMNASGRGICQCAGGRGRRTLRDHSDAADVDRGHGGATGIGQPRLGRQHVAAHRSEARRPRTCDRDGAARRRRTPGQELLPLTARGHRDAGGSPRDTHRQCAAGRLLDQRAASRARAADRKPHCDAARGAVGRQLQHAAGLRRQHDVDQSRGPALSR